MTYLYTLLFSRQTEPDEAAWATEFVDTYRKLKGEEAAWTALCQTLLISNEFLHVW